MHNGAAPGARAAHQTRRRPTMLQRLRRKIVLITMSLVGLVTVVAFVVVLGFVWHTEYADIHTALTRATTNGPEDMLVLSVGSRHPDGRANAQEVVDGSGTTLPITAVFLVDSASGAIYDSNADLVSMNESVRDAAIGEALVADADEGQLRGLGVFYQRRETNVSDATMVAFADARQFNRQITTTAELTGCACVAVLAVLLLASVLLARVATRPVERTWEQQRRFVADASHELKTPLTVIIANNDILRSRPELSVGQQMRWVEGTASEATRMRGLIEDMLTLARDEESDAQAKLEMADVDLSALVEQASLAFDAVAFETGVEVREQVAAGLTVRGDRAKLERLVKTLVDNAVKYAGMGGTVSIELSASGHKGRPVLNVNNTGPAIPHEELPHVFDRFWRSDTARTHQSNGGYGLGLAIAKSIAESHGARISVTSDAQSGTTFTVAF